MGQMTQGTVGLLCPSKTGSFTQAGETGGGTNSAWQKREEGAGRLDRGGSRILNNGVVVWRGAVALQGWIQGQEDRIFQGFLIHLCGRLVLHKLVFILR